MSGSVWKGVDYSGRFWKEACRRFQSTVLGYVWFGNGLNYREGSTLDGSRGDGLCYQPYIKEGVESMDKQAVLSVLMC